MECIASIFALHSDCQCFSLYTLCDMCVLSLSSILCLSSFLLMLLLIINIFLSCDWKKLQYKYTMLPYLQHIEWSFLRPDVRKQRMILKKDVFVLIIQSFSPSGICIILVHLLIKFKLHFLPESVAVVSLGEYFSCHLLLFAQKYPW